MNIPNCYKMPLNVGSILHITCNRNITFVFFVQLQFNFASRTVNQNTNQHPTWHQCADFFLPECYRWRYHIAHETLETMIWSWLLRKQQLTLDGILQLRVHNHCAVQRTVMNQMGLLASLPLWLTIWNETNKPSISIKHKKKLEKIRMAIVGKITIVN